MTEVIIGSGYTMPALNTPSATIVDVIIVPGHVALSPDHDAPTPPDPPSTVRRNTLIIM